MRKNLLISVLFMAILFLFNSSCEEKTTKSRESTDFEAIKAIIYENPDIFLVDVFDTSVNSVFYRKITSRDFDLETAIRYEPDPSHPFPYITADWGDSIKGVFHHFIDGKEYTKPIYAHSVMHAYFEQWGDVYDPHRGWLLKKISGNVVASVPTRIIPPVVHITSEGVDTFFSETMVLNIVKTDSVLRFAPGKKVTFTVDSEDISDVFLFLHVGEDGNFRKIPFEDNQDGTFSASCTTTTDPNIAKDYKHAFVEAISRDALTDTTADYDSKAWGIIYRIKSDDEYTDWDAIKAIIYENPDIFLVDVFDTHKDTSVNPIFFREITSRDFDLDSARRYEANPSDPFDYYILAAWGDTIKGIFHYFIDGKEYTKPIYAHSVMHAYFEQWLDFFNTHRGWLLKKISGNVIASVPTQIIPPVVHISSEGVDTSFSETFVLNKVKKDAVLSFAPGKKVTFTVKSEDISGFFLFLHVGEDGNFRKIPFVDNEDGTFSASWTTTSDPKIAEGYKHAFVDAVSRESVTDTTAEYDSKAWGIIYKIK